MRTCVANRKAWSCLEAEKAAKLLMNKYVHQAYCALFLHCTTALGLQTMLCEYKRYICLT